MKIFPYRNFYVSISLYTCIIICIFIGREIVLLLIFRLRRKIGSRNQKIEKI
ncbi:DUF1049 domain-containing protein [Anabaena minutissima FACHB-250]|nr:DUF1049 domain-containing protein [Anabaena minutissima FACHB-250]